MRNQVEEIFKTRATSDTDAMKRDVANAEVQREQKLQSSKAGAWQCTAKQTQEGVLQRIAPAANPSEGA